jgi:hypothetical protein
MSYQYSWEEQDQTIWDTPELWEDNLEEFVEYSSDIVAAWEEPMAELEDEESFLSLEQNPDMEDWLMRNV